MKDGDQIAEENYNKNATELFVLLAEHRSSYSVDDRLRVAMLYVAEGNMKEVMRKTGINYETLKSWKVCEWWPLAVAECRKRKQDELDGNLTKTIHIAMGEVLDRIQNGDSLLGKTGP